MEQASRRIAEMNIAYAKGRYSTIIGRVPTLVDISSEIGDNQWFGREVAVYAAIYQAALEAECLDMEAQNRLQKIIYEEEMKLKSEAQMVENEI